MIELNNKAFNKKRSEKDFKYAINHSFIGKKIEIDKMYELFQNNHHPYLNTCDRLDKTIDSIGNDILTVASSGDYLLDLMINNRSSITCFDSNDYQYYILSLKLWASQILNSNEFYDFFSNPYNPNYLSSELLDKIISEVGDESKEFWKLFLKRKIKEEKYLEKDLENPIIKNYRYSPILGNIKEYLYKNYPLKYKLVQMMYQTPSGNRDYLDYLDNYEKINENLNNIKIKYISSNIRGLKTKIKGNTFDMIYLSNIPYYLNLSQFLNSIDNLNNLLKEKGIIDFYCHNMHKEWFNHSSNKWIDYITNNYLDNECYNYLYDKKSIETLIKGINILKYNGYKISIKEFPSYDNFSSIKSDNDLNIRVMKK